MREKLIELISGNFCEYCNVDIVAGNCKIRAITFDADKFADFLISNGVRIETGEIDFDYNAEDVWK